jgi:cytochrome c-type biogenesis protein CcmH/NrfG
MIIRDKTIFCLAVITGSMLGQTPNPQENWKTLIGRGVASFKLGQYGESITVFQQAVDLNPGDPIPHLYLGIAWQAQFVPGSQSTTSGDQAAAQYHRAVELDAANWPALVLLAQLARDRGNLDEARSWYQKALQLDPANADTWVALGALALRRPRTPASPQVLDQGISDLRHALSLDPHHEFAMMFLDALYRQRGDSATAAEWRQQAENERGDTSNSVLKWPPPLAGTYQIIRDTASAAVRPLPPPPPPPPGARAAPNSKDTGAAGWTFRHIPSPDGLPPPMLVNPVAQERNLVRKVDPVYPSPARGTIRIGVIIAKDGHVRSATLTEGDPVLADAALQAVRQWVYRPVVSNWEPVEVRSEVLLKAAN